MCRHPLKIFIESHQDESNDCNFSVLFSQNKRGARCVAGPFSGGVLRLSCASSDGRWFSST